MKINRNNQNAHKREMLYMSTVAGKQKEIKVTVTNEAGEMEEVTYLLQHPGVRAGVQLRDGAKDINGNVSEEKFFEALMQKVIVQPRTNWDYWEKNEGMMEVMKQASTFLVG